MRISFDVNGKAVLAVVAVGALCVGSFYAGEYHERKTHVAVLADQWEQYRVQTIPNGVTEESWCKAHPSTSWKLSTVGIPAPPQGYTLDDIKPLSGSCDGHGQVWEDVPTPAK